ncbi:MAG: hypothetical protein WAK34_18505 [Rhodoplanes sp.]
MHAIGDYPAIDEDRDVLAQNRLVVEQVAARLWIARKNAVKNFTHGTAGGLRLRAEDVSLDVGVKKTFAINGASSDKLCAPDGHLPEL